MDSRQKLRMVVNSPRRGHFPAGHLGGTSDALVRLARETATKEHAETRNELSQKKPEA